MSHKLMLHRRDDEHLAISLDDEEVGSYSHDHDGWQGMAAAEKLARRIAEKLGVEVEEVEG